MKTKQTKIKVPKALEEVWEWKEAAWEETKNMSFSELKARLDSTMDKTAKSMNAKVVTNENGSQRFVK